ncbi:glycosyltransferase family 4 protein [Salinarchaeum chitinilyticum]
MKVLQVVPRYPPRTGGVETHVQSVSERLADNGIEVTVLTADAGGDVPGRETRSGVSIERYHGLSPGGAFHIAPGIYRAVRRHDADIVHAHNYHALPVLFAGAAARDAPLVVTPHYHGGSASSLRDRMLSIYHPLGKWVLQRADAVTAVSEWERTQLRSDFGVAATVVPNGLDVGRFEDAMPESYDGKYLLTVGRLEEYKGVQYAIRALPLLPEYDLLIAGTGPHRETLETTARDAGVEDRVVFLGYVDDERLPGLYAGADAYLNLSAFEAYGMTVGETLSAGTPAVVRETRALADWTRRDGVVGVGNTNPETIADAVRSASTQTALENTLQTWDDVAATYLDLYETLLSRS